MSDLSVPPTRTNLVLGIAIVAFAALIAFVWIPVDVETGIYEKVRRRYEIGDAFQPVLAVGLLGLGGLLLVIEAMRTQSTIRFRISNLYFALGLLVLFATFILLLTWTGPALVKLFAATGAEYRLLRDTAPWKYAGFVVGGTFLIAALVSFMEHRFQWQSVVIGLLAVFALILLYDLPFDDLLLPPNGDF